MLIKAEIPRLLFKTFIPILGRQCLSRFQRHILYVSVNLLIKSFSNKNSIYHHCWDHVPFPIKLVRACVTLLKNIQSATLPVIILGVKKEPMYSNINKFWVVVSDPKAWSSDVSYPKTKLNKSLHQQKTLLQMFPLTHFIAFFDDIVWFCTAVKHNFQGMGRQDNANWFHTSQKIVPFGKTMHTNQPINDLLKANNGSKVNLVMYNKFPIIHTNTKHLCKVF